MDLYSIFKLMHVIAAIAWVGGGLTLIAQATFKIRDEGPLEVIRSTQSMGLMAVRWFLPASALTLVCGLIATFLGNMWSQAWVILGLAGFAATFVTGHFVLRVKAENTGRLLEQGREGEAVKEALALLRVSKFDYTVVLMVVVLMVLKPQWEDQATLGLIAGTIGFAGLVFLLPPARSAARAS